MQVLKDYIDEWNIVTNISENDDIGRDSIWFGAKCAQRTTTIISMHRQFIHSQIENLGGYKFFITIIYEDNQPNVREEIWRELMVLKMAHGDSYWILSDDFNEMWVSDKRVGHGNFNQHGADTFNAVVDGLHELDSIGRLHLVQRFGSHVMKVVFFLRSISSTMLTCIGRTVILVNWKLLLALVEHTLHQVDEGKSFEF